MTIDGTEPDRLIVERWEAGTPRKVVVAIADQLAAATAIWPELAPIFRSFVRHKIAAEDAPK